MACSSGNTGTNVTATEGAGNILTFVPATDGYPFEDANHGEWSNSTWWVKEIHYDDDTVETLSRTDSHNQPNFVTGVTFETTYVAAGSRLDIEFTVDTDLIPAGISSILIGVASTSANQTSETESDFCLFLGVTIQFYYGRYWNSNQIGRARLDQLASATAESLWTAEVSAAFDGTGFFYGYGGKIYYTARSVASPTLQALWRRNYDGTGAEELHTDTAGWTNQQRPVCGRGAKLFYTLGGDCYIKDLPSGSPTKVATETTPWWASFAGDDDTLFFWNFGAVEKYTISTWTLLDSVNDYVWHGQYDETTDRLYGVNGNYLHVGYWPNATTDLGDPWDPFGSPNPSTFVVLHAYPTSPDDPRGVYVDTVNQKVYWTNNGPDEIWSMNTDGTNKTQVRQMSAGTPWPEEFNKNSIVPLTSA